MVPLPVAPVPPKAPVVPLPVAPVAPSAAAPAEALAGNCPSFVGLKNGQAKSKFNKVFMTDLTLALALTLTPNPNPDFNKVFMTDDEYCEKNCRAGFCPESR